MTATPGRQQEARAANAKSRPRLDAVLGGLGPVAAVEGMRGVLVGTRQVVQGGLASANVDSEYRFYSAWYHVAGLLLLGAARQPEAGAPIVRAAAGGFLLAACGRVLSLRSRGRPHPVQLALIGVEFVLPVVILTWQARVTSEEAS